MSAQLEMYGQLRLDFGGDVPDVVPTVLTAWRDDPPPELPDEPDTGLTMAVVSEEFPAELDTELAEWLCETDEEWADLESRLCALQCDPAWIARHAEHVRAAEARRVLQRMAEIELRCTGAV